MKRFLVALTLVFAVVIAWWAVRERSRSDRETQVAATSLGADPAMRKEAAAAAPTPLTAHRVQAKAVASKLERNAVHRRILDALARRAADGSASEQRPERTGAADEGEALAAGPHRDAPEDRPGNIHNRLGDDDPWGELITDLMSEELSPLADECFANARERSPDLGGMAAIAFTVVADEDVGGVVESAEPTPANEIAEHGFVECMRESTLSMVFPPPEGSGRRDIVLTMPFGDD